MNVEHNSALAKKKKKDIFTIQQKQESGNIFYSVFFFKIMQLKKMDNMSLHFDYWLSYQGNLSLSHDVDWVFFNCWRLHIL